MPSLAEHLSGPLSSMPAIPPRKTSNPEPMVLFGVGLTAIIVSCIVAEAVYRLRQFRA